MKYKIFLNTVLCLFILLVPICSNAGDFAIELGLGLGPEPTGEYKDDFIEADGLIGARFALRYAFDFGLVIGREAFNYAVTVKHESQETGSGSGTLITTVPGFTIGLAFGDDIRFVVEAAIPESAVVSLSNYQKDEQGTNTTMTKEDKIDSRWYGLTMDFGFGESSWGLIAHIRSVKLVTDNFMNTGKSFDASGLYYGISARYRWE